METIKIKIIKASNKVALRREIKTRAEEIGRILTDPRNCGYEVTTANGTALVVSR